MVYESSASSRCAAGPKIAAIGGGTGLSTMLRGLKKYTDRLTAIVTVADDGGGSGVLRREMGILPPGDVRQCMQALANTEPVMEQLLGYRFPEGQLKGQSFGNLLLAALNGMAGSFEEAVAMMGQVLAISGRVLPVTNADVQLEAVFENGARVVGESHIFNAKKQQDCRIHHVSLVPEHPKALPDALRAISEADLILLGPGSLYTSVIPNLLVDGVADAIRASHAQKFYICNIMTQDGETEGYTAADHLAALLRHERDHGRIIWVMGPAFAFDAGARAAMEGMIENGYCHGLLAGNALGTHDLEAACLHTALGQDIYTQRSQPNGHYHHLDVLNRVRRSGSIPQFIQDYHIDNGILYGCVKHNIPFVLTGSIRDDGPLPEVYADAYQGAYAMRSLVRGATTVICLATMLHTIAAGNMTPSFRVLPDGTVRPVYLYAVDADEFVVNKLRDRGSLCATTMVTNVQDFITKVARDLGVYPK